MLKLMTLALLSTQSAPAVRTGVHAPATAAVRNDPATYDLAGFRLGMDEAQVEASAKARGMVVRHRTRVVDFETNVLQGLNRQGGSFAETGRSVLGDAELDDGKGGTIRLQFVTWSDGAHLADVAYDVPAGTDAATWRRMLTEKYGVAGEANDATSFVGKWCGRKTDCFNTSDRFRLTAHVGPAGGQIELSQPEGTRDQAGAVMTAEISRRSSKGVPSL